MKSPDGACRRSPSLLTDSRSTRPVRAGGSSGPQLGTALAEDIGQVEKDARGVGMAPAVSGGNPLKRRLKSFLARVVLGLSRFITTRQREFNVSTLTALRDLVTSLRHLEQVKYQTQGRLDQRLERALQIQQETAKELRGLRAQFHGQERRLRLVLEAARGQHPASWKEQQFLSIAGEEAHSLDALRVAFEDDHHGTREERRARLQIHLRLLRQAAVGTSEMPLLDLGAGRGEWLELLQEQGWHASGIECSPIRLQMCQQRELPVTEGEPLAVLRTQADKSLGAVTGLHVVDHLPLTAVVCLLHDEVVRVLKPGGLRASRVGEPGKPASSRLETTIWRGPAPDLS